MMPFVPGNRDMPQKLNSQLNRILFPIYALHLYHIILYQSCSLSSLLLPRSPPPPLTI